MLNFTWNSPGYIEELTELIQYRSTNKELNLDAFLFVVAGLENEEALTSDIKKLTNSFQNVTSRLRSSDGASLPSDFPPRDISDHEEYVTAGLMYALVI